MLINEGSSGTDSEILLTNNLNEYTKNSKKFPENYHLTTQNAYSMISTIISETDEKEE